MFKKILIFLLPIAVLFVFAYILFIPKQEIYKSLAQKLNQQTQRPDIVFKGSTFSEIVDGIKYWEIRSAASNLNRTKGIANLEKINGIFFENNVPVLGVVAPSAKWDMGRKEIIIDDPVGKSISKITEKDVLFKELKDGGFLFASKSMCWRLSDKKIICRDGVVLKKDSSVIKGQVLRTDVALAVAELTGNPEGIIDNSINITSDKFVLDGAENSINVFDGVKLSSGRLNIGADFGKYCERKNEVMLWGNVKAIKDDMILTGDRFLFGIEDKKITGSGNIVLEFRDIRATGNNAFYSEKEKTVIVSGRVKADKSGNIIFGDKVTVDLAGGRLKISGKSKAVISESQLTTTEVK